MPTTQCQQAAADPESVAVMRVDVGEDVEDGDEQLRGMGVQAVLQTAVMSAISVLEVQFHNNVQFPKERFPFQQVLHSKMTNWLHCQQKRLCWSQRCSSEK